MVLIALAERANASRVCWPSLDTISEDTGYCKRTAHEVVHRLKELGLIEIVQGGRSLHYRILRPGVSEQACPAGAEQACDSCIETCRHRHTTAACDATTIACHATESLHQPLKEERGSLRSQGEPDLFSLDEPAPDQPIEVPAWTSVEARSDDPADRVMSAWNEMAAENDLPKILVMTPARRRSLATRIGEVGLDGMLAAIAAVAGSAFCRGVSDSGWRADFDFILQPKSLIRLLEGRYTRGAKPRSGKLDYLVRMMAGEMPGMTA
jgi:hypothetical protein